MGGHNTVKVDIHIIAATNRNLPAMVDRGDFRQHLFYCLNVIHLEIPPLRERQQDIPLLANHFLQKFCTENQREIIDIDPAALAVLQAWQYSRIIERD